MPDTVLITTSKLDSLAEMVAAKSEESLPLTIDEMRLAVQSINTLKQAKTVTPTTSTQTITPDSAYGGLSQVTVNPIPSNYIIPSGTLTITANDFYDVTSYAEVNVYVPTGGEISLQAKTNINPTTSSQTITADSGYNGLSSVQINAMPSGSVTSPATISGTSASISTGTNTLTLSKTISITPNVTTAGYISAGTAGNSAVSLTASITTKAAATITPTTTNQTIASGTYLTGTQTIKGDSNLVGANIKKGISIFNVAGSYEPAGVSLQAKTGITPTEASQTVTADAGYDGLSSVQIDAISDEYVGSAIPRRSSSDMYYDSHGEFTAPAGYYSSAAHISPAFPTYNDPVISVNTTTGLITVTHTLEEGMYSAHSANVTSQLTTINGTTITPTESEQTAVAANRYTLGAIKVGAISSTYVGSGITTRNSNSLTVSGATVTAPAGYYASAASKSVATMTLPTSAASSATSGYTSKATIGRSTSDQYINIPTGYNTSGAYYKVNAIPDAVFNMPETTISNGSLSTGTNTLTLTAAAGTFTANVTTAGYFSGGQVNRGTIAITANVTTKAAATITPTTSNQTIASGTYLTGMQTIAGDANLVGSNILSGKSIFGVAGTVTFQTYYTGSSAPSSSTGVNGDIYLQT